MQQSYIKIFQNSGDGVTIAYSAGGDSQQMQVDSISIELDDLYTIGRELIAIADELAEED